MDRLPTVREFEGMCRLSVIPVPRTWFQKSLSGP
jgi:hypothetical protein